MSSYVLCCAFYVVRLSSKTTTTTTTNDDGNGVGGNGRDRYLVVIDRLETSVSEYGTTAHALTISQHQARRYSVWWDCIEPVRHP